MQTNREDIGNRYREVLLPVPKSKKWADSKSLAFRNYFTSQASAKKEFYKTLSADQTDYIASVFSAVPTAEDAEKTDVQEN